jgi:D-alanyl-D-alanine-carboxypeptidase/D-alanyl-D-alanine-endopeptidase
MPKDQSRLENNLIKKIDGSSVFCEVLSKETRSMMECGDVTGLGIGIFNDGMPVYTSAFGSKRSKRKGRIDPSTVFYGASLSKPVFSVLVLMLVEEGVISLDTPLHEYLPLNVVKEKSSDWWTDFSEVGNHPFLEKITARMCLSHTTGLPNWRWLEPENKLAFKFEPGTRYGYSGEGYCFLQNVIEKITGTTLEVLAQKKIFRPLGMGSTSYRWRKDFDLNFCYGHSNPNEIFPPDKGQEERGGSTMKTTLHDYMLFVQAILNDQLLTAQAKKEMFTPQIAIDSKKQFGPLSLETGAFHQNHLSYGLGWGIFFTPFGYAVFKEGHGDGFAHYTILFPVQQTGMVALSNSFKAEGIFKKLFLTAIGDAYSPWEWEDYQSVCGC